MKDHMDSIEPLKAYYDYRGDALSGTAPILEYTEWLEQRYIDHHHFEDERIRLQSLLHSAIEQADATYAPYRKMVQDARDEVDKTSQRLFETRCALHNLVEACHRAANEDKLAGEIDGELMSEAWRVLK